MKGFFMKSLTLSTLEESRLRVQSMTKAKSNLASRLEALENQQAELEKNIVELQSERGKIMSGVAHGSHSDTDLTKCKNKLSKCQDSLTDVKEMLLITRESASGADRDLEKAKAALKAEEQRAWRTVAAILTDRHKPEVEEVLSKLLVALTCANNTFEEVGLPHVIGALDLRLPYRKPEDIQRIKSEMMAEFGL
jgi:chromosome segregation ATPase